MNYELAKKLKNAGFPQEIKSGSVICTGLFAYVGAGIAPQYPETIVFNPDGFTDYVKYPTLSELIEACGRSFSSLNRAGDDWLAVDFHPDNEGVIGKTPSEAVAKLWLALNEK